MFTWFFTRKGKICGLFVRLCYRKNIYIFEFIFNGPNPSVVEYKTTDRSGESQKCQVSSVSIIHVDAQKAKDNASVVDNVDSRYILLVVCK